MRCARQIPADRWPELRDRARLVDDFLAWRLQLFIPLVLSLTVHEWAHAWSAWKLGDDTARRDTALS